MTNITIPVPNLSALKLSGYKTYIAAVAAVAYAGYGYYTGHMGADQAAGILASGSIGAALRAGVAKQLQQIEALVKALQAQLSATPAAVPPPPVQQP